MKKVFVFLLLFAVVFTICGCQNNNVDVIGKYENDTTKISADTSNDEEVSVEEFSLGKTTGNIYKSDFIGIGCELDENWSFYNDEQIKELNNLTLDMAGDEFSELIKEVPVVNDMFATDNDQLDNINISLEKVDKTRLLSLNIAENFKVIAPMTVDALKNMGYESINYEIGKVEVDGKTLDALHITGEINGVNAYQTTFQKKCNGYLANITVATYFDNTISDLIDNFYWTK